MKFGLMNMILYISLCNEKSYEYATQVIRGVESRKFASAFVLSAAGRGGAIPEVPGGWVGSQRGLTPNCRTGWGSVGLYDGLGVDTRGSPVPAV